jgi:hypothetical protein
VVAEQSKRSDTRRLTREDVYEICGRLNDGRVASLLAVGGTPAQLLEAWTWLSEDDYLHANMKRNLSGQVARLYEVLAADQPEEDNYR